MPAPYKVEGKTERHRLIGESTPTKRAAWAAGIFILALGLRILASRQTADVATAQHLVGDAAGYVAWGQRIAAGDWLGQESFYQAPLYPYVLGGWLALCGATRGAIVGLQCVLGALSAATLCLAARRWFGLGIGVTAGAMYALYAPAIYFDVIVQKTTLDGLLVCGLWWAMGAVSFSVRAETPSPCPLPRGRGRGVPDETAATGSRSIAERADRHRAPVQDETVATSSRSLKDRRGESGPSRGDARRVIFVGVLVGLLSLTRENALVWIAVLAAWAASPAGRRRQTPHGSVIVAAPRGGTGAEASRGLTLDASRQGERPAARDDAMNTHAERLRNVPQGGTQVEAPRGLKPAARSGAYRAALVFLGAFLALGPVALRNRYVGGEWSLTTFQAGPNFYIGNHAGADGRYEPLVRGQETPEFERRDATVLAEQATGRSLRPREVSRFWLGRAWGDIGRDPTAWCGLLIRKTLMTWNRYEVADAESIHVYAESSSLLRVLSGVWHFGVLVPVAAAGMVLTRRRWRELWVFYALAASLASAVAAFYVLGRYRFALAPLLIPFAAAGCVEAWGRIRRWESGKRWRAQPALRSALGMTAGVREAWLAVVLALIVAMVVNIPVHDEARLNAMARMNAGVALARAGDLGRATELFRSAVRVHPASAEAQNNLAQALAVQGRFAEAAHHYETALSYAPTLVGVHYNYGVALERLGRLEEAARQFGRAVELDPHDADARESLERLTGIPVRTAPPNP